mmetsp:Transcript_14916/g.40178  ORF Transcript_14916/g.40178 Transcript_14916/m.40178 type:complete len:162 (+) Transcript_14916:15-500(+)
MEDWLDDGAEERDDMERERARLEARMATLGFNDGLSAGEEAALQEAFDTGFREGLDGVPTATVRLRSMLATFVEFYSRHGAALGLHSCISGLVFALDETLAASEAATRMARVMGDGLATPDEWSDVLGLSTGVALKREDFEALVRRAIDDTGTDAIPLRER